MLKRVLKPSKPAAGKAAKAGAAAPASGRKDVAAKAGRPTAPRSSKTH